MKCSKTRRDDMLLEEAYNTIINEGTMAFDVDKFIDILKNISRFLKQGEISSLGIGSFEASLRKFHMTAEAKRSAESIVKQRGHTLLPGASTAALDSIVSVIFKKEDSDSAWSRARSTREQGIADSGRRTRDEGSADFQTDPENPLHRPKGGGMPRYQNRY